MAQRLVSPPIDQHVESTTAASARAYRWTRAGYRRGLVAAIPVAISVASFGVVFGALAGCLAAALLVDPAKMRMPDMREGVR